MVKFSGQMEPELLESLRLHAKRSNLKFSHVLGEAARLYLQQARVRPAFKQATKQVLDRHDELLRRLAK